MPVNGLPVLDDVNRVVGTQLDLVDSTHEQLGELSEL
jgi:hypothetical protein